jgi:hypothetical protein
MMTARRGIKLSTPELRQPMKGSHMNDEEIERAAAAEFKRYMDRVKDMELQAVQIAAQEEMLQQLIRIRLELTALRQSVQDRIDGGIF